MKNSLLFLIAITIGALFQGCAANDTVIIAGQVVEASSGNAVEGAVVEITDPAELNQSATTDSTGSFSFDVDIKETVTINLEITKQGFQGETRNFKLTPEASVSDLSIELTSSKNAGDDDQVNNEDDVVEGESGVPASLELVSISSSIIAIDGTGGDETSKFVFAVRDSAGRPVDKGYRVNFSILTGPSGGEYIDPATDFTNSDGIVQAAIASGDSAGVVKIEAAVNENIKSTPVLVAIGNGFPTYDNFHIAPVYRNFEAFGVISNETVSDVQPNYIVASLGDYNNNPVLTGTAVDFTTTAGNIDASAITDEKGIAIAELRPDGSTPTNHPSGVGFVTATARTVDANDNYITKSTTLLFTTPEAAITASPMTFSISNGSSQSFTYTVTDMNGYPMAAGTTIEVEAGNGLTLSGDVSFEMPDRFTGGSGVTEFAFSATDADPVLNEPADDVITITVTTPSGERSSLSISGSRAKTK